jgi:hypothetical protein
VLLYWLARPIRKEVANRHTSRVGVLGLLLSRDTSWYNFPNNPTSLLYWLKSMVPGCLKSVKPARRGLLFVFYIKIVYSNEYCQSFINAFCLIGGDVHGIYKKTTFYYNKP